MVSRKKKIRSKQKVTSYSFLRSMKNSKTYLFFSAILVIQMIIFIFTISYYSSEMGNIKSELDSTKVKLENSKNILNKTENDLNEMTEKYENLLNETTKNKLPKASIIADSTSIYQGEKIIFDGSGSNDIDGEIVEYEWDFGNGDFASGGLVEYIFIDIGTHIITLSVTDNNNELSNDSITITVSESIIIEIIEIDKSYNLHITLTLENKGPDNAGNDNDYWTLHSSTGGSYQAQYTSGDSFITSGTIEEIDLSFYDIDGEPQTLVYKYKNYYVEVDLDSI